MSSDNSHNHDLCACLSSENIAEKRLQMINRIVNFCSLLSLDADIFHLAVNYLDRTLCTFQPQELGSMALERFRCIVACCAWLAFKFHGTDTVDDCSTLAKVFEVSRRDMVETELDILRRLSCSLYSITTYSLLVDALYEKQEEMGQDMLYFAHQLCILCLLSAKLQMYDLKTQAAAVLFLSLAYKRYYAKNKETQSASLHEQVEQTFPAYAETKGTLELSSAISDLEQMILHVQTSDYYQIWRMRDEPLFSLRFVWKHVSYRDLIYSDTCISPSSKKRDHLSTVMFGCKEKNSPPKLKRCEAQ